MHHIGFQSMSLFGFGLMQNSGGNNEPTHKENEGQENQSEGNATNAVTSLQFQFFLQFQ